MKKIVRRQFLQIAGAAAAASSGAPHHAGAQAPQPSLIPKVPRNFEATRANFVSGSSGREAKLRLKLTASKERNWLLGLYMNTFARASAGMKMAELEQKIVDPFQAAGLMEKMAAYGKLYHDLPQRVRTDIFPSRFSNLSVNKGYSFEDLKSDMPVTEQAIRGMRNVANVNVEAVHNRTQTLRSAITIPNVSPSPYRRPVGKVDLPRPADHLMSRSARRKCQVLTLAPQQNRSRIGAAQCAVAAAFASRADRARGFVVR